jgi:hypothetical protein
VLSEGGGVVALEERPGHFTSSFRMNCECGGVSTISGSEYHTSVDAMMPCGHCGAAIHFGRAVAALRDPNDAALDNANISRLAWYHTSTSPDWPSPAYEADLLKQWEEVRRQHAGASWGMGSPAASKALHVGTYQAAVVNMLRRMHDQNDAGSQFYLYRVALDLEPHQVNDGYRDENHAPAALLTTAQLEAERLSAVRYLNVYEDMGSLSLAVLPSTITSVQRLALPVTDLVPAHDRYLEDLIVQVEQRMDRVSAEMPDTCGISPIQLRMMAFMPARDPQGIGALVERLEGVRRGQHSILEDALAQRYLVGVCPVIADKFNSAIHAWRTTKGPTARETADFYAANAVALTRPDVVMRLAARQEPKPGPAGRLRQR